MRSNLINARKRKGLTQAELGKKIGRSMQTVSALENSRIDGRPIIWDALESILGVSQRELRAQTGLESAKPSLDNTI